MQWTTFNVSVQKVAFFSKKLFIPFYYGVGFFAGVERGGTLRGLGESIHYYDAGKKSVR